MNSSSFRSVLLTLVLIIAPSFVSAQEWSAQQKEVWKNVEAYWALDAAGDTAGFLTYFHDNYSGWSYQMPLPGDKATATKFIQHGHKTSKTLVYHVQPVAIRIEGNIAIVHYYWSQVTKSPDEPEDRSSGRWTDVLMKQGEKWVLIADHGGRTPKNSQ